MGSLPAGGFVADFIGGFTVTFLLIIGSGIVGGFLFRQSVGQELISDGEKRTGSRQLMTSGIVLCYYSVSYFGEDNIRVLQKVFRLYRPSPVSA